MAWYDPFSWSVFKPIADTTDALTGFGKPINGEYFVPIGAEDFRLSLNNEQDYMRAYLECAPVKTIIKRRASAFNTGIIEVVKTTASQNYVQDADLLNLINNPNPIQTQKQFFAQQNTYIDIHGYCPVLKIRGSTGFENLVTSIWNIPPWLFEIEATGKWLQQNSINGIFKNYKLNWGDGQTELDQNNLFFVFDDIIGTQNDAMLIIPDSRLRGLDYNISNIIGTNMSRNTIINKRGAIGILSNDSKDSISKLDLDPKEKTDLQNDFKKYGLTGQPFQVIVTNASLKWQSMSVPVKDMQLLEGIESDIKEVARAYGYPSELLSMTDVPYLNRKYCKKELYSDTIIPEGNSRMEQFSRGIIPADKKIKIQYNFDNIDVLQEEKLQQYQAEQQLNIVCQTQFNSGLISQNDWRIRLGLDAIPDPTFDLKKEQQMTITETEKF